MNTFLKLRRPLRHRQGACLGHPVQAGLRPSQAALVPLRDRGTVGLLDTPAICPVPPMQDLGCAKAALASSPRIMEAQHQVGVFVAPAAEAIVKAVHRQEVPAPDAEIATADAIALAVRMVAGASRVPLNQGLQGVAAATGAHNTVPTHAGPASMIAAAHSSYSNVQTDDVRSRLP